MALALWLIQLFTLLAVLCGVVFCDKKNCDGNFNYMTNAFDHDSTRVQVACTLDYDKYTMASPIDLQFDLTFAITGYEDTVASPVVVSGFEVVRMNALASFLS